MPAFLSSIPPVFIRQRCPLSGILCRLFSVHFSRIIARTSAPHCPVSASFASGFVLRLLAPHSMRVFFLGSYAGFNPASCSIWVVYLRWLLFDPCGFAAWSSNSYLFLPMLSYFSQGLPILLPLGRLGGAYFLYFCEGCNPVFSIYP